MFRSLGGIHPLLQHEFLGECEVALELYEHLVQSLQLAVPSEVLEFEEVHLFMDALQLEDDLNLCTLGNDVVLVDDPDVGVLGH